MVQAAPTLVIYVNPAVTSHTGTGSQTNPLRTLTRALQQATPGTTIQLAAGTYSVASGELFPLQIPVGIAVVGNEVSQGHGVVIEGSGSFNSVAQGLVAVAVRLETNAQLRGITVTNPAPGGVGIWVESTAPTIARCTISNCAQTGIVMTGTANPLVQANVIMGNGDHGILVTHQAKGEVRGNQFRNNGFGIAIQNDAAPLLADNQVQQNRWGIFISHQAKPVLRGNVVQQNREGGLAIINTALPDLGRMGDPGGNSIQNNQGSSDVTNATERRLVAVGNQLNPSRLQGEVVLSAEAPQPPATIPAPAPVPSPPTPTPPAITSQFQDIAAHWAEAFIRALIERRVLRGFPNGTFQPEAPMTRAEFAATIVTAFPIPDKRQPGQYTDVPSNFWAAQVIRKADSTGFMSGFPDGSFRPHLNLTRVQAMVAVVQGLGLRGGGPSDLGNYRDRAQIPSYAVDAIATATQRRLVVNYPLLDHLHPMRNITRAEVAALIYQGLVAIGAAPAIASPFIVNPMPVMTNFTDVQGHWAAAFIAGLAGQRMIGGFPDGSFRPDGMMTRVQYCGLLVNAFNPAPKREAVSFTDVPANFWGAAVIQRAYRGGFISGFTHGMFRPHDAIARVQVLVSLVQGLGLPPADLALLHRYLDQDKIPAYARNAVASATANHLVLNYPVQQWLNPNLAATRGEVTAMVYQALVRARRVPAIASPFIITV